MLQKAVFAISVLFLLLLNAESARGQLFGPPPLLILGDSLGEGVQSADASWRTQPFAYGSLVAGQARVPLLLPLIQTSPLGVVGDTSSRRRIFPFLAGANLAVSGTDVHGLLNDRADGTIDSETDLVLSPRRGSQVEIAERLRSPYMICWVGSNDVLSAVLSFDQLDASQMTPAAQFKSDFSQIAQRLRATGRRIVFGNVPDVHRAGFLVDRDDLIRFLGTDLGLPPGFLTSAVAMFAIRLGLVSPVILADPNFVLDPAEILLIEQRVNQFNQIIAEEAAAVGMPVADVKALYDSISASPPLYAGVQLSDRFLGGIFSLDGVHPSNIGHALVANTFIETANVAYGLGIPLLSAAQLNQIAFSDPFIDKDGDGRVSGRFLAGLLETLAPILGISGDANDFVPQTLTTALTADAGSRFMQEYQKLRSNRTSLRSWWTGQEALDALRDLFDRRRK